MEGNWVHKRTASRIAQVKLTACNYSITRLLFLSLGDFGEIIEWEKLLTLACSSLEHVSWCICNLVIH